MPSDEENEPVSNVVSFHYARMTKTAHDESCVNGIMLTTGTECDFCSLRNRLDSASKKIQLVNTENSKAQSN